MRTLFLRLFASIAIALITGISSAEAQTASGDPINTGCRPLDVVVLLDQSSSMSNSDTLNLRMDAVSNLIDVLYDFAAIRCVGDTFRIGVIGFGDEADVLIELEDTSIRVEDVGDQDWETQRDRLKSQIVASNLGNTSFLAPLEEARRMFDGPAPDESRRGQLLLIVTDGAPCTQSARSLTEPIPELGGNDPCGTPEWLVHYLLGNFPQLLRFNAPSEYREGGFDFQNGLANFYSANIGNNTPLNVLLFQRQGAEDSIPSLVNDAWRTITAQTGGRYYSPEDLQGSLFRVTGILDQLVSEQVGTGADTIEVSQDASGECTGSFYLEPYASSTTIIATTRPGADQRVRLFQPNGQEIQPQSVSQGGSSVRYREGRTAQRFVISNPTPGEWQITDPTGLCDVRATAQTIPVNVDTQALPPVVPFIVSPYFSSQSDSFLNLDITDSFNRAFSEVVNHPLSITGTVTISPVDNTVAIPAIEELNFSFVDDGLWRSDTPVPAPVRGSYIVNIEATVESVENPGATLEVFSTTATYETTDPVPVSLEITGPIEGARIPLNTLDSGSSVQVDAAFDLSVQFIDEDGNPQPRAALFPNGVSDLVIATLEGSGAIDVPVRTIALTAGPDEFTLQGRFQKDPPNNAPDPEGPYRITVIVQGSAYSVYNRENYVLQTSQPVAVNIQRPSLSGVRLVLLEPQQDTMLMLNRIDSDAIVPVENDIPVRAELTDQSGNPLIVSDIFSSDTDQVVRAVLRGPNGSPVGEPIFLSPSGIPSQFAGVFSQSANIGEAVQPEGIYTIELDFGTSPAYNTDRYALLSPASTPVSFERIRRWGVEPRLLTVGGTAPAPQADPLRFELNALDSDGFPVPTPIDLIVALADLEGQPYSSDTLAQFLTPLPDAVTATIRGLNPGNDVRETVSLALDTNGRFTGQLRAGITSIDAPGLYEITVQVNPAAINSQSPMARYELVRTEVPAPAYIERFARRGVEIVVSSISGVALETPLPTDEATPEPTAEVSAPTAESDENALETVVTVPYYDSLLSAALNTVGPLTVELVIRDTFTRNSLDWTSIRATEDVELIDLITLRYQAVDSTEAVSIDDPAVWTQEQRGDGSFVLVVPIIGILDTNRYVLTAGLNSESVDNQTIVNFTDTAATPTRLMLKRGATEPWLQFEVWQILRPVIIGVFGVIFLYLLIMNMVFAMSGTMTIERRESDAQVTRDIISLGGFRIKRSRRGKRTGARVRRAGTVIHNGVKVKAYSVIVDGLEKTVRQDSTEKIGKITITHRLGRQQAAAAPPTAPRSAR